MGSLLGLMNQDSRDWYDGLLQSGFKPTVKVLCSNILWVETFHSEECKQLTSLRKSLKLRRSTRFVHFKVVLVKAAITVMKCHYQKQLWRKGLISAPTSPPQPITERSQGRNSNKIRIWRQDLIRRPGGVLTVLLLTTWWDCFLYRIPGRLSHNQKAD